MTQQMATYSPEMAARLRRAVEAVIAQMEQEHEAAKRELLALVEGIEARAGQPVTLHPGRDPYAGAPAWADQADQRVERLMSIPDEGNGGVGGGEC